MKIKKNDEVIVLTGKYKGKKGKVIRSIPSVSKVVVSGINLVKRHHKADNQGNNSGVISKEMPISVSNVSLIDPKSGKATRVGYKVLEDGKKVRISKRSGEVI